MPSTDLLIAFILATALFAYIPGPGMLYAAARTLSGGRRAGLLATLGLHLGGYVHVLAAALGLAVLFETVPVLYAVMKGLGALYLIWLGMRMMGTRHPDAMGHDALPATASKAAFWQSVAVEVLNPKTALFFLAFLPQFTDPAASLPIWAQLLILGSVVNVMFSSGDLLCVLAADKMTSALRRSGRMTMIARRLGGGLLIVLGLRLGLARS